MTRDQIIETMLSKEPRCVFHTMELGGNGRQLAKLEDEGVIRSQRRYGGNHRQRNWYLTHEQHAAAAAPAPHLPAKE